MMGITYRHRRPGVQHGNCEINTVDTEEDGRGANQVTSLEVLISQRKAGNSSPEKKMPEDR